MQWESVIGLEVHVQLSTKSKLFSGARNQFGDSPNQNTCPIDLAFPGTLPVVNENAIRMAIRLGLALGADIARVCHFDRKNYFYPDLPKGYQVTQSERPIFSNGSVAFEHQGKTHTIHLHHAHLEEDAGKSIHGVLPQTSGIDLNRAGTPLLEIVTEPDFRSAQQACAFLKKLHTLVRYLDISDGNMAEGSLRCDANVSIRPVGETALGVRSEIKNLNSFKFIEQAVNYEIERQIHVLETGGQLIQETRLYDPDRHETRSMRSKEDANDYRYFPDPDLLPIYINQSLVEELRHSMPELDHDKFLRYQSQFGLNDYDAAQLTADVHVATFFENTLGLMSETLAKPLANWIITDVFSGLNKRDIKFTKNPITPAQLANLVQAVLSDRISNSTAKKIMDSLFDSPSLSDQRVDEIIQEQGLAQVSDAEALKHFVQQVIAEHSDQVQAYLQSPAEKQKKMLGFFLGQLMKQTKGQGNPKIFNALLLEAFESM